MVWVSNGGASRGLQLSCLVAFVDGMDGLRLGSSLPSRVASLVHAHFDALPPRSKPTIRPDGSREWVPMTGLVVVKGMFV